MIYINFDLETTGPSPHEHAILSIGAVAHEANTGTWKEEGYFSVNLFVPDSRGWDEGTLKWWKEPDQAAAFEAVMRDRIPAAQGLRLFMDWLVDMLEIDNEAPNRSGEPSVNFVAYPVAYDLPFLRTHMREFVGSRWIDWMDSHKNGLGGVDIQTLAMAVLGRHFHEVRRKTWPGAWNPPGLPHDHTAINDARHQAHAFIEMMKELDQIRLTCDRERPTFRSR